MRGFWQGADLGLRERLNLYPSDDFRDQQQQIRQQDRLEILAALTREDLIASDETYETIACKELSNELAVSIQRYLARSQSMLLMVQLEDLLLQSNQVNVPGTIDEYPNWRSKLSTTLEYWPNQIDLEAFAFAINAERNA
jgi:(1->4)-alpha-D-glucan 1-alpha-D-glucosylmutase